jgi:hypothetical protein
MTTANDLMNHQLELMYWCLIMMGLCLLAGCLTFWIGINRLAEAIEKSGRQDVLDLRRAFGITNRRLSETESALHKVGLATKRLIETISMRPIWPYSEWPRVI